MKKRIKDLENIMVERQEQKKPGVLIVANNEEAAARVGEIRPGGVIIINNLKVMRGYLESKRERG